MITQHQYDMAMFRSTNAARICALVVAVNQGMQEEVYNIVGEAMEEGPSSLLSLVYGFVGTVNALAQVIEQAQDLPPGAIIAAFGQENALGRAEIEEAFRNQSEG